MKNKMSIWIILHPWSAVESGRGYEWELYLNGSPIAKSSPVHGDTYFYRKASAIKAAKRMRRILFPRTYLLRALSVVCPITDVTNRGEKPQKVRII